MGFLSTSNDGNARLWSLDGTPLATMPHPATREGDAAFVLQVSLRLGVKILRLGSLVGEGKGREGDSALVLRVMGGVGDGG